MLDPLLVPCADSGPDSGPPTPCSSHPNISNFKRMYTMILFREVWLQFFSIPPLPSLTLCTVCALAVTVWPFLIDASYSEKIDVHTITYQQLVYAYTTLTVFELCVTGLLYSDSRNKERPRRELCRGEPRRGDSLVVESLTKDRASPRRPLPGREVRRGESLAREKASPWRESPRRKGERVAGERAFEVVPVSVPSLNARQLFVLGLASPR
jgi:hypothetical protein